MGQLSLIKSKSEDMRRKTNLSTLRLCVESPAGWTPPSRHSDTWFDASSSCSYPSSPSKVK
jgi:hypothetical protein